MNGMGVSHESSKGRTIGSKADVLRSLIVGVVDGEHGEGHAKTRNKGHGGSQVEVEQEAAIAGLWAR